MKEIRTEHAAYAAWDYELEIEELNKKSEQGWQLIKGGCFHSKYEKDDSIVYRYQIDFHPGIVNRMRYVDVFREQGWEYINSTINGWHYFRKAYDASLPASEYEIYSDRPSKQEMAGRLSKVLALMAVIVAGLLVMLVVSMFDNADMARLGIMVEMIAGLILAGVGAVRMRAIGRGERPKRRFPIGVIFAVMVCGLAWFLLVASAQPQVMVSTEDSMATASFRMLFPDWVEIHAHTEAASGMLVSISGEEGYENSWYWNSLEGVEALEHTSRNVFLKPGEYTVQVECEPENASVEIEIH